MTPLKPMAFPRYIDPVPSERPPRVVTVGLDIARRILDKSVSGKILVYIDPDPDGLVAGYFIVQALNILGKQYYVYVNPNRGHGFLLKGSDVSGLTVINGDFLVTRDQVEEIVQSGGSILSMDHHDCATSELIHSVHGSDEGVVINNHYGFEDERGHFQSGAGVTFEVLSSLFPELDTVENRALVGMTLLTDVCDINSPWAHWWLWHMYHAPYQGYVKYLIDSTMQGKDYGYGEPNLSKDMVGYTISPAINALLRYDEGYAAVDFILGGGYPSHTNYLGRQRELVKQILRKANLIQHPGIVFGEVKVEDFQVNERPTLQNFVGLSAGRFCQNLGADACIIASTVGGVIERASFRSRMSNVDFREHINKVVEAVGHGMAFGIPGIVGARFDTVPWDEIASACSKAINEASESTITVRVLPVSNLYSFFYSGQAYRVARWNMYHNGQELIYVQYTGKGASTDFCNDKVEIFRVDNVRVTSFQPSLALEDNIILPLMDRGKVKYYLEPTPPLSTVVTLTT